MFFFSSCPLNVGYARALGCQVHSSLSLQGQGHLVPEAGTWTAEALSSGISFPGAPVWSVQDTFSLGFKTHTPVLFL